MIKREEEHQMRLGIGENDVSTLSFKCFSKASYLWMREFLIFTLGFCCWLLELVVTQLRLINYLPLLPRSSSSLWRSGSGRLGKVFVTLIIVRLTFELNFREKFTLICIRASLS